MTKNKAQKKKASQQSGNPVVLGVPEIMTPAEFQRFMDRLEKKHANFMSNLETDEKRKAAEKQHKVDVKALTEHIHVMKPSEAAKLGSEAESKLPTERSAAKSEDSVPVLPKQQKASQTPKLPDCLMILEDLSRKGKMFKEDPEELEFPSDEVVDREHELVKNMIYSYSCKGDLVTYMCIKAKMAKIGLYEEFVDKCDKLDLGDRLDGLYLKTMDQHLHTLKKAILDLAKGKRTVKMLRIMKEKLELLKALDEFVDLAIKFKSDMNGIREQEEKCKKVEMMMTEGIEDVLQMYQKPSDTKKSLNVGAFVLDLLGESQEASAPDDFEDLEGLRMPTHEDMCRELEILENMEKEEKTDELSLKLFNVKVAKVDMYNKYVKTNNEFESTGFDLDFDNAVQEALIAIDMLTDLREGRGDEQKLAMLQQKIDHIRTYDQISNYSFVILRNYKNLCKQEENLKKKIEQEGSVSAVAPAAVQAPQKEQKTSAPTPEDAFQFPTDEDLSREIQILSNMQKQGRTDPSFQKALNVKQTKIEIYKAFLKKVDELQLRDRLEDLTVENMERDAKDLQDTLTDFQKGDVKTMPVLREKIDSLVASLEINEIVIKLKSDLKGIREQEEQYIKE